MPTSRVSSPMGNVGEAYVPSSGPLTAKILVVGEAPGIDEEREGQPFIGKSGQFLERYLNRIGIQRKQVRFSNLCKYRPSGNKFVNLLGTKELGDGLLELSSEIAEMPNLNLILAVGNWPMYYLTGCTSSKEKPGTGIMNWRGSVVRGVPTHVPAAEDRKVLITFHPAFIVRPQGFGYHPIFFNDLKRIKLEWDHPEINYPKFDALIDPPNTMEIIEDMSKSPFLTVDIETFGSTLACVGITDSVKRGLCVTCNNAYGWDAVKPILASNQPKNFQFGAFDINYLWWYYGWEVGGYPEGGFDTYIGAANLLPEFNRGLDFLTSIYTPFPYYKEERKTWKNKGDLNVLWNYNIKDLIAQHWTALEQMKELRELYPSYIPLVT